MKAGQEKQQAAPRLKSHHLHNQGARFVKQQRSNLIQPTWPLRYSPTPVMVPPVPTPLTKMSTCQDRAGWEACVVGAQPPVARPRHVQAFPEARRPPALLVSMRHHPMKNACRLRHFLCMHAPGLPSPAKSQGRWFAGESRRWLRGRAGLLAPRISTLPRCGNPRVRGVAQVPQAQPHALQRRPPHAAHHPNRQT